MKTKRRECVHSLRCFLILLLITRKKAHLPAYGPVGRLLPQALTKQQERVSRGYGSRVREVPWTILYLLLS